MINILNEEEIANIKKSGRILKEALSIVEGAIRPGIDTKTLDEIAEKEIRERGAVPSFKNYEVAGVGRYPASLCVSINDEIVHGLPNENRVLKEGDIISLDLGVVFQGMCTDMATTLPVGQIDPDSMRLIDVARESLKKGIEAIESGKRIGVIGATIQNYVEGEGFHVIRDLVGHGVGKKPHLDPKIPNYGKPTDGPAIENGMALAIEPMISIGSKDIASGEDGWTYITSDGSRAAHFEHTVIVENGKPFIVTE